MFKGMGLGGKLLAGFGAVLAIAAALGIFAYTRLITIDHGAHIIAGDCLPGIYLSQEIQKGVKDNLNLTLLHMAANDKAEMDGVEAEMARVKGGIDKLFKEYEATITKAKDRETFEKILPAREKFLSIRNQVVLPLSRQHKTAEAKEAFHLQLKPAYDDFLSTCQAVVTWNKENGDVVIAEIFTAGDGAKTGILIGLAAAIALTACIGIFLGRSISASLNSVISSLSSGSEQVSSASRQVSQSSQQMAEGASQQASSLEETSASLEEMSSMTKQNSDNARQANGMAAETRAAVEKSREAMTRMGDAIGKIKGSSDQTAKIIKTIDEIAFQTNLLALNAAVEAARAGDAGKGFAVVAEEVRNLAQRSAEAAKTTASLIEESQQNANNGVAVSGEVAGILSGIVESVAKLTQLIGEVSSASEEQSKGIGQIGTAVTEMDKLTQSNAANAEESASASEELAAQAKELGDMVQILVGIVKGQGARANHASVPPRKASLPRAAGPLAASQAPVKPAKPSRTSGPDWSGVGSAKASHGNANGQARKAALSSALSVNPEQVIPMDDSDLKDF